MNNSIKELNNELVSIWHRADKTEERISDREDKNLEMMCRKERRERLESKGKKGKNSMGTIWLHQKEKYDYNRCAGKRREQGRNTDFSNKRWLRTSQTYGKS